MLVNDTKSLHFTMKAEDKEYTPPEEWKLILQKEAYRRKWRTYNKP